MNHITNFSSSTENDTTTTKRYYFRVFDFRHKKELSMYFTFNKTQYTTTSKLILHQRILISTLNGSKTNNNRYNIQVLFSQSTVK